MIRRKFSAGRYYIGDLAKILDYADLISLERGFGLLDKFAYANFELECDEIKDSDGFIYSVDSANFGIIDAKIIDEELLSSRILTLRHGFIANKFGSHKLARIVDFGDEFEVAFCDNEITFENIILNL